MIRIKHHNGQEIETATYDSVEEAARAIREARDQWFDVYSETDSKFVLPGEAILDNHDYTLCIPQWDGG